MVRWSKLTVSRKEGCQGIRNLKQHNFKSAYETAIELSAEGQALWRRVITENYATEGQWVSRGVTTPSWFTVWRPNRASRSSFSTNVSLKVKMGRKILSIETIG